MIVKRVDDVKRVVELMPESGLDLINLFRLVKPGDVIYSRTTREVKKERASGRIDSERVQAIIGVEVESKSADPLMRRVRFTGRIVYESPELDLMGRYHTITLHPGVEVRIQSRRDFERLRAFSESFRRRGKTPPRILCVSIDDEELAIAEFSNKGLEVIYSKHLPKVDKSIPWAEQAEEVYEEALRALKRRLLEDEGLGVAVFGPKIFVENFLRYLERVDRAVAGRVKASLSTSVGGEAGLGEILRSRGAPGFMMELKPFKDSLEVERLIEAMSRNPERVAVGIMEVREALRLGAAEKILISERYLWGNLGSEALEEILEAGERGKVDIQVILDGLEASEKLSRLGGIAAALRYPLPMRGVARGGAG